ncbi:aminotransferase class V-fold PLP-dependent enzyme [Neobacillus sp. Marseille-QA0830]
MATTTDERKKLFSVYRNQPNLVYFDYAATTFMPDSVVDAWVKYQTEIGLSANRNRSWLGVTALDYLEQSRTRVGEFFQAGPDYELIFTKNATESLNIAAKGFSSQLAEGDIILLSSLEHHSNLLPWQKVAEETGAIIVQLPLKEDGGLEYELLGSLSGKNVKVVSMSLISNVTGHQLDYQRIKAFADQEKAPLILDISQAAAHQQISLSEYQADAYALSAHKMYGPKSIGGLFLKKKWVPQLEPFMYGGGMVWSAGGHKKEWADGHQKFEAGTFDVGLAYAWSKACDFIEEIGSASIEARNASIYRSLTTALEDLDTLELVPNGAEHSHALVSFDFHKLHSHDLEAELSRRNILIRTGHMCSQNTLRELNKVSLNRLSWGIGVTDEDVDYFIHILRELGSAF